MFCWEQCVVGFRTQKALLWGTCAGRLLSAEPSSEWLMHWLYQIFFFLILPARNVNSTFLLLFVLCEAGVTVFFKMYFFLIFKIYTYSPSIYCIFFQCQITPHCTCKCKDKMAISNVSSSQIHTANIQVLISNSITVLVCIHFLNLFGSLSMVYDLEVTISMTIALPRCWQNLKQHFIKAPNNFYPFFF